MITIEKDILYASFLGDIAKLYQILLHFLYNACRFSHPEGSMNHQTYIDQVSGENEKVVKLTIRKQYTQSNIWHMILNISDNGIGMTEEHVDGIFNTYSSIHTFGDYLEDVKNVHKKKDSHGLSMGISYLLIKSMQGDICIESSEGLGSNITITLPLEFNGFKSASEIHNTTSFSRAPSISSLPNNSIADNSKNIKHDSIKEEKQEKGEIFEYPHSEFVVTEQEDHDSVYASDLLNLDQQLVRRKEPSHMNYNSDNEHNIFSKWVNKNESWAIWILKSNEDGHGGLISIECKEEDAFPVINDQIRLENDHSIIERLTKEQHIFSTIHKDTSKFKWNIRKENVQDRNEKINRIGMLLKNPSIGYFHSSYQSKSQLLSSSIKHEYDNFLIDMES
jgi:hypothetical protein